MVSQRRAKEALFSACVKKICFFYFKIINQTFSNTGITVNSIGYKKELYFILETIKLHDLMHL
jgi:hypothetical protein